MNESPLGIAGRGVPAYKRWIPRPVLRKAAVVLVAGAVVGSFLPGEMKRLLGTDPEHHGLMHRIYHFVTFGSTALAYLLLAERVREELRAAVLVFGLACLIEGTQRAIGFSQVFEWWDVRDDFLAVLGVFVLVQVGNWLGSGNVRPVTK
jgi:heme A synthase